MASSRSFSNRDDSFARKSSSGDEPPMSRLFIICNKTQSEEDFRKSFSKYGELEDVWVVKDKRSGENKGVCYIKFSKTSEAALALEELNGEVISGSERPIKVVVAANRDDGAKKHSEDDQDKCCRLFIVTPRTITEEELRKEFSKYGEIEQISIIKDRNTGEAKGFAYIKFQRFSHAALAFENCPSKYRPVFAEPKTSKRSSSDRRDRDRDNNFNDAMKTNSSEFNAFSKLRSNYNQLTCLEVICNSIVNQDQLWRLFDIVPGLDYCQFDMKSDDNRFAAATVVYENAEAARFAQEKLHGLEYPLGERLIVKVKLGGIDSELEQELMDSRRDQSKICSVDLPPIAPLADPKSPVAKRCFIVVTETIPNNHLKNVFCTMGNLIDVYLLSNKNFGYAKYATENSAKQAIAVLHGAEICGVRIKVMEAEDPKDDGSKRMRMDN